MSYGRAIGVKHGRRAAVGVDSGSTPAEGGKGSMRRHESLMQSAARGHMMRWLVPQCSAE